MAERRKRGLGRGLGALIPDAASSDRPVDVFFSGGEPEEAKQSPEEPKAPRAARTDPAATMQSSRRRKPKAAATTGSSSDQTVKKEPASGGTTSTKRSTTSTTTKSGASQSAPKKAAAGEKATGAKAAGAKTTSAKTVGTKSSPTKTATGTTVTAKSNSSKSTAAKASGTQTSPAKARSTTSAAATPAAKKPTTPPKSASPAKPSTETDSVGTTPDSDFASVSPSTAGDSTPYSDDNDKSGFESPVVETAEPDVEATSVAMTDDAAEPESEQADEVSETHPGVYRSGHETFDEARSEPAGLTETTNEVEPFSGSSRAPSDDVGDGQDDDSTSSGDSGRVGVDSIPDTEFGEIDVERIEANPRQPRTFFDEDQLSELVHSIREIGVLQPVVVRQKPGDIERFELIMGERRLRATKDAGLATIPAIIRYVDDTDLLRDALLENLHRAELNPLEEAAAYGQLLEDFGCTQEELSERIGRSRPQISNTLRLLRLPPLVQRRVAAGVISAGHARAILGLREPEHMEILAQRIVAEGLSVRASEEAVVLLNRGDSMNVSRATTRVSPQFIEVAERLGDRLDTKVNITVGKKKGKLSVEFANQDDLDRILILLGVEEPAE